MMSQSKENPKMFLEVVTDLLGPVSIRSIHGNVYAMHFTEVESKYRKIYFLKTKEETKDCIIDYYHHVKELG
jgi:hypothetical protein